MPTSTDILPDLFSGTYHLLVNPETRLVPTGYDKTTFSALKPSLDHIEAGVTFERLEDADGAKLLIELTFNNGESVEGFYYRNERYSLESGATGLKVACRSIVEIHAVVPQNSPDENEAKAILQPLVDREFIVIDKDGGDPKVISWLELIAEGSQILANKAFIASQLPPSPIPTQL
jgi:hypothetical protein